LDSPDLQSLQTEREVILRLQRGDAEAVGVLFQWYGDKLFRQVILPRMPVREQAEDILRDTFRLALERIAQFLPGDRSIFFWLRRIAVNRTIDVHRAQGRVREFHQEHLAEETAERTMGQAPPAPDRGPEAAETRVLVELALSQMNPRYALALRLRLLEEREREECAQLMGVNVGNFDVILHRACKAFRGGWPPTLKVTTGDNA
jgi:RNA polymerase sigma factor (sigma-70 family)